MQISEPMTMATDYVLSVLALWLGRRLLLLGSGLGQRSQMSLGGSFLMLALAAFLGGTSHGFAVQLGDAGLTIVWRATMLTIGVTGFLFLATAAFAVLRGGWRRALVALGALELLVYWVWILFVDDDFVWAIYDYVPAMVGTAALMGVLWWRESTGRDGGSVDAARTSGREAAPWILAGIGVSLVGAAVQASGVSLHESFNHNDLYHVIQMASLYLLYRGGRRLRDH